MNLKNLFSLIIISFLFSCSNPNYEYVLKDDAFRKTIKTGNFTELTNGFTYYEIENRFNENTLVFIHGFSVPSYIWDKTYNTAKEKGFKVVKLDLYGRGFSDNPDIDYTDELFANQVIELLQELEIKKATFLGLSNVKIYLSIVSSSKSYTSDVPSPSESKQVLNTLLLA